MRERCKLTMKIAVSMRRKLASAREQTIPRHYLRSCTQALMEETRGEKGI